MTEGRKKETSWEQQTCADKTWRETIRTERTTFLENEDVPANYRCTRKTAERMEDNYYCWRLFPIMELLCKMRRKTKPEHKDEICVARWTGGICIWPANLASTASTQANKQNNTSLRTGLRGPVLTANTDIKRNNGRRRRKHSGKIGAKSWQESSSEASSLRNCDMTEASKSRRSTFLRKEKWGVNYWSALCSSLAVV